MIRQKFILSLCTAGMLFAHSGWTGSVSADDRRLILDHRAPTGLAGQMSAMTRPAATRQLQPVKFDLPTSGQVDFFTFTPEGPAEQRTQSPSLAEMAVGHVYRLRISGMPDFPGVELYPTVEILDRLNPPPGLEYEFPIPIQITAEEINTVLQHRMVTKVVYLEQQDLAYPEMQVGGARIENLPPTTNLLKAADMRGRPLVIVRIGGRVPDQNSSQDEFYRSSPLNVLLP